MSEVTAKLLRDLEYLEPFGAQNSQPLFYMKGVTMVQKPQLLKAAHVKCLIFSEGIIKPIVFFNRPELFELLQNQAEEPFDVAVQVTENHWQGRSTVELLGIDIAGMKGTK